jgi:hypothetical protein
VIVQRAGLERSLERGAQPHQMPAQPVHRARALGDEIAAVIQQQADLHRLLIEIHHRKLFDPVLDDRSGDRERVDLIRLARLSLPLSRGAHPVRSDPHDPLASGQQHLLNRRETARQSSIAQTRCSSRSCAHRTAIACPGSSALISRCPRTPARSVIDRRKRTRALVRVRPDHDHMHRPFGWMTLFFSAYHLAHAVQS